jgi:hypothetical protein
MPWYAELVRLPAGYDNSKQQVWYIGKRYRVSYRTEHTAAVHTPKLSTPEWIMDKEMARRLFSKPYWSKDALDC